MNAAKLVWAFLLLAIVSPALAAPPDQVTNVTMAVSVDLQANISWTPSPTATGYLVVIQAGLPVTSLPVNGAAYTANFTNGAGSDLGGGQYVVYSGSGTNVIVQTLLPYMVYYATVYAYTGSGAQATYQTASAVNAIYVPTTYATLSAVQRDPTVGLTNYFSLGEWNTDTVFDGWSSNNISSATVSNGILSGVASGSNPELFLVNFANGPDLDLAFNDYIDMRLQVPTGYTGNVELYYGVTNTPGISASRLFTLLNTNIAQDGGFHVYRVLIGPQVFWRGVLRDLRIDPLGTTATNGEAFALDYVRVGDLAGDIYAPRYSVNNPGPGTNDTANNQPVMDMSSKHFRVAWDNWDVTNFPTFWTATMPHGTLRNFEEVWKDHVWRLGYREPAWAWTNPTHTGGKSKVNVTMFYGGYFTGGDAGNYGWVNITPDGMRVEPPTWVPPHEFGHALQMHQNINGAQNVDGQFWESHANYVRERWIYSYGPYLPGWNANAPPNQSGLDPNYSYLSHLWIGHGRDYYLCWPIYLYFDENPDGLQDLGEGFTQKIWQTEPAGEYFWTTAQKLMPHNSLQDVMGYMARRNVTWDYSHHTGLLAAENAGDAEIRARWVTAELHQRADDPTWWQVPIEFAPQQTGYKYSQLIPTGSGAGRIVTVNFHGLPDASRGADWRASFVVVSDSGAVRYSSLWNSGSNSVTLAANENTVYVAVAGTPTAFLAESIDDTVQPYQSAASKARFPYEMQITGATPFESTNGSTAGLVKVANGGGFRATSATVASTAFVGPNARVLGTAKVLGNAKILDYAIVEGSATVSSNAVISGHALVRNSATVTDNAKVRDYGTVIDNSTLGGYARVLQHGQLTAGSIVTNWATVKGSVSTWHDNTVSMGSQAYNDVVLDGDFSTAQSCSNGFQFGFEEYNPGPLAWITNRTAPRRLYAAYEFNTAHDSLAKDFLGVTDGYLQGNPGWIIGDGQRNGFMSFNGANQFVILDKSLSDLSEISVTAWVKWSGGISNQPAWYFGAGALQCMYLTPDDGTGHAKFSIINGGLTQTLVWSNALPVGVWTHVALTLSNAVSSNPSNLIGRLYVNGTNVASGSISIPPDALNAPNVNATSQQNYLARGAGNSLPFFQGALDSVRVYTGPLTDSEIAAMQPGPLAGLGTLYVDLRATNAASSGQVLFATWTNLGLTVGNFTKSGSATFSTNVGGTGVPGILFDGTTTRYLSSAMSIADITGAGDRTMEVWAYNPSLADEETMVSLGDRSGTRKDCAFNFGSDAMWGAVTQFGDDIPWGAMGTPSSNAWHHFVYTYDGNLTVQIYLDGLPWYTDTLKGVLATPIGDTINIGCQRATSGAGPSQFFSGYINAVRVWGGAMSGSQVAANFSAGPWVFPSAAKALAQAAISNITVNPGVTITVTNSATDPNLPPLPLAFSLAVAPANAIINSNSGVFTWRPAIAQANTTNSITVNVADNANPALSSSRSFTVTVNPVTTPSVGASGIVNGQFSLSVNGVSGPDVSIQTSSNLMNWTTIFTTNSPPMPFNWTDSQSSLQPALFYRVLLGP